MTALFLFWSAGSRASGEGLFFDVYGASLPPGDYVTCSTVAECEAQFCARYGPSANCVFTGTKEFGGWGDSGYIRLEARKCSLNCEAKVDGVLKAYNLLEVRCNAGYTNPTWTPHPTLNGVYRFSCSFGSCPAGTEKNEHGECVIPYDRNNSLGACPAGLCPTGNPVQPATGNKFQIEADYTSSSPGILSFRRYYNSHSERAGLFGYGWSADYGQAVVDDSSTSVKVRRPDGKVLVFTDSGSGWVPDPDITFELTEILDQGVRTGWQLKTPDNTTEIYDYDSGSGRARLDRITDINGHTTTLVYDLAAGSSGDGDSGTLDRVTGPFGRTLSFSYNADGFIDTMTDPAGNAFTYDYADQNLVSVTAPLSGPATTTRTYHYENVAYPHSLTGITDENGNRYATYTYDNYNRVVNSQHAGGAGEVSLDYNVDSTTITDALGNQRTLHFEVLYGIHRLVEVTGDPCTDCGNRFREITYDGNGFIASRTDFNGNTTTYTHNARGLETSRTEAAGTPEERTITTEWHPDFRLPVKVTEPGKITTFTYDSQGRLLERKEEAVQ